MLFHVHAGRYSVQFLESSREIVGIGGSGQVRHFSLYFLSLEFWTYPQGLNRIGFMFFWDSIASRYAPGQLARNNMCGIRSAIFYDNPAGLFRKCSHTPRPSVHDPHSPCSYNRISCSGHQWNRMINFILPKACHSWSRLIWRFLYASVSAYRFLFPVFLVVNAGWPYAGSMCTVLLHIVSWVWAVAFPIVYVCG